jgi:hypothetical protein
MAQYILNSQDFGLWRAMTEVDFNNLYLSTFKVSHLTKDIVFYCNTYGDALDLAAALDAYDLNYEGKSERKFTIEEIRNYILSQDSLGDVVYFLSEESIIKANEPKEEEEEYEICGRMNMSDMG